jgi:hypothetical protein
MSTTHELKCVNPYFEQVLAGVKTAELREPNQFGKPARNFQVGDTLVLREWIEGEVRVEGTTVVSTLGRYTGREVRRVVSCVTEFSLLVEVGCSLALGRREPNEGETRYSFVMLSFEQPSSY